MSRNLWLALGTSAFLGAMGCASGDSIDDFQVSGPGGESDSSIGELEEEEEYINENVER